MEIVKGSIDGLLLIKMNKKQDDRGFFARNFCTDLIEQAGGNPRISQANLSFNETKGTLRGFHYQINGHEETKTLTVLRGSLHLKVVDLRKDSKTYLTYESFNLTELDSIIQIPKGCAPGFQTLLDGVLALYYMSDPYSSDNEYGIRFNDPFFKFNWPLEVTNISKRDLDFKNFDPIKFEGLKS
jgi:dTDP-4-dehydrorhamnose 3,5-epimerase